MLVEKPLNDEFQNKPRKELLKVNQEKSQPEEFSQTTNCRILASSEQRRLKLKSRKTHPAVFVYLVALDYGTNRLNRSVKMNVGNTHQPPKIRTDVKTKRTKKMSENIKNAPFQTRVLFPNFCFVESLLVYPKEKKSGLTKPHSVFLFFWA